MDKKYPNKDEAAVSPGGPPVGVESPRYRERVYELVRRIPVGRVMTYGQLAELLGEGYTPRTVGFVMHAADENDPWHRVINAQGACCCRPTSSRSCSKPRASSST